MSSILTGRASYNGVEGDQGFKEIGGLGSTGGLEHTHWTLTWLPFIGTLAALDCEPSQSSHFTLEASLWVKL